MGELLDGCIISRVQLPEAFTFKPQGEEVLRIDKDGMVFMGQRITDAGEAYEVWMKTLTMMQMRFEK